ncbi:LRR receptor-like serine/threonine-protein kinase GSO2 [Sesamum indicum]|uniref:LRR receptor-like serine/threonine-protein kinase GSO2 n=1 Tax=Sesamum indicum TaxID=4182 RepID=A0A6I9TA79_SESIN|nr:LRR receptor-like serine/threonine-protein kinase GSO2 [Sesamum indicum]
MRFLVFSWLLFMSLLQILCLVRVSGQCLNDQRSLLLQLKSSLVFNLTTSTKLVNWNQNSDCCNWDGVGCDGSGHVIRLDLENEFLSGGIENSTGLFGLRYLQNLNLASNSFNGIQIPKGLQNLTNLAYLNLSNAGFGGQVPVELSEMRSLVSLDLSSSFQGVLPLRLEKPNLKVLVQNLTGLRELYLDGVNISAQASDWSQALSSSLPDLRSLSLRRCGLSGPLDPSLSELQSLSVLHLDRNNLSTTIPDFLANFSSLTTLTLSFCSLQGTFPDMIFQLPTLETLDLSNNKLLGGTISEFPPNGSFTTIVLSYTNFSGTLPDSISNLRMLSKIDLSNCEFTGQIPSTITNLTELVYLDFSFNSFTGSIPLFHMSKKLTYIDLSRNSLTGSLSSAHFEGLSNLGFIHIGYNSLNGSIPESLFSLPSLQKLQLSNNKFSGRVGEFSTSNSSNLDTLDLSSNQLEGPILESFFKLERLNVLSLSSNFLNGTVHLEKIQRLHNLTRLELGYNNLSVSLSSSNSSLSPLPQLSRLNLASCNLYNFPDLRNQSRLTFLDLSNNHIEGEIPSWIWEIGKGGLLHLNLSSNLLSGIQKPQSVSSFLSVLDLHSNQLQGEFPVPPASAIYVDYSSNNFQKTIPLDIGNSIPYAMFFSIANNSLTGTIPASFCNATYLQVLDLSVNNLSGSIPPCLVKEIENLGVLNLGRNNIIGDIPDTFPVNCGLKTLDLSRNKLGGQIPPSLANCKSLEVMNVGNNKINDGFPCILKNSSSLRVLVLRSNNFHGDIRCPGVNQSWPNLQIIDIAFNNFNGSLYPRCISSWRGMSLDNDAPLRRNHLSFKFLDLNNFYYQDTVTVTIKGLEMELVKILTVFTSIDFSCNNFVGDIPATIGDLSALYILNLSHNSLTGTIPMSIGNLTQLGSLDLSVNKLTGEIPKELTSLTFLSFLNLSYNMLVGRIPAGSQFVTFSASSYIGNTGLCGFPLNISCHASGPAAKSVPNLKETGFDWQFIFTGLGYGVGAALVIAPIAFCKEWRETCNKHLDQLLKMIFPRYGFSYVRCDGKVESIENIEDKTTDDDEDEDGESEDNGDELSKGRYCIFCTKLDIGIKRAMHNPKCICHYSPPTFFPSPTSSSSSSLLVIYQQNF